MLFKPVDETSLRHLLSSELSKNNLKLYYIGPVIGSGGGVETSPDALVLDMRRSPYKIVRCEFKFIPACKNDFAHNGQFDIAVIWSFLNERVKNTLAQDLLSQNGCHEIIALSEVKSFSDLPVYTPETIKQALDFPNLKKTILKRDLPVVVLAYMAAKVFPSPFNINSAVSYLSRNFPSVQKMSPQGRANVISAFTQTKPPLFNYMNGKYYRWNSDIDPLFASELATIIRQNFMADVPSTADLSAIL